MRFVYGTDQRPCLAGGESRQVLAHTDQSETSQPYCQKSRWDRGDNFPGDPGLGEVPEQMENVAIAKRRRL
jgi:hypothetical protein